MVKQKKRKIIPFGNSNCCANTILVVVTIVVVAISSLVLVQGLTQSRAVWLAYQPCPLASHLSPQTPRHKQVSVSSRYHNIFPFPKTLTTTTRRRRSMTLTTSLSSSLDNSSHDNDDVNVNDKNNDNHNNILADEHQSTPPSQPSLIVEQSESSSSADATVFPLLHDLPTKSLSSLQAIIFDIDGTLADSWKLGYNATLVVLEKYFATSCRVLDVVTEESYHQCTKYSTPQRLARHVGLDPNKDPEFDQVGMELAKDFDELYVGLVTNETAGFFPGINNLLHQIVQPTSSSSSSSSAPTTIKLGALTNACVTYAHAVLQVNSYGPWSTLYSKFESIHGADTVPSPKPDPDGLLLVCAELGVHPQHAIYIGDSPSDAMAAHQAGMASIGVTWGSHSIESLQKAPFANICSSVEDLGSLLMELSR
jgi:phosphoglycolate phosphatase-like HAD superfamily hydrolase